MTLRTEDGRDLEVLVDGPETGLPLIFHNGTPSAAVRIPPLLEAAAGRGLRTVTWSRPGYGSSTPLRGRRVADVAADASAVLRHLDAGRFVTLGWSGGGPHALACAALLPGQCAGAATLAGVAPRDAAGLDWPAGMAEENLAEFGAAEAGEERLTEFLEEAAAALRDVTGERVAAALGGLVSDVDEAALTGGFADVLAEIIRKALSSGTAGWRDDDLAFVRPWGFELSDIQVPVAVWQGAQDRMVPISHGRWLAAHIPGARPRLLDGEGHLSLLDQVGRVVDDLAAAAGVPARAPGAPGLSGGRASAGLAVHRLRPEQWRRWRGLRLRALAESPEAFSSTYEENVRLPAETWRDRTRAFAAPTVDRAMFVAADEPGGDWIGCAGGHVDIAGTANLISMWVAPEHRGRGVGRSLVEAVIEWARAGGHERLRLDVVRDQGAAVRLYGRLGFRRTGRATPMPRAPSLVEEEMVLQVPPQPGTTVR